MKKRILATLSLVAILLSQASAVTAQTGIFLTGGAGFGLVSAPVQNTPLYAASTFASSYSYSNLGAAFNGGVGYQQALTQNFSIGIEAGYNQLGSASANVDGGLDPLSFDIKNTAWQVLGNLTYLWNSGWNVFVNAGSAHVTQKITGSLGSLSGSSSLSQTEFAGGLGVGYQFSRNLGVNAAWLHVSGANNSDLTSVNLNKVSASDTYTANLVYTFPLYY